MAQTRGEVGGRGYDPAFLGIEVATPTPGGKIVGDVLVWEGETILPYTHFSLTLSVARRLAFWVAWNIDGGSLKRLSRARLDFVRDSRIPATAQVGNELYAGNRLDRGHLARRSDLTWGSLAEAQRGNIDSFCYTNIAPQMDDFNQSSQQGLWGRLEDALYEDVEVDGLRSASSPDRCSVRMIRCIGVWGCRVSSGRSWPIAATVTWLCGRSCSPKTWTRCALMALDEFRLYQVDLPELEERTELVFSNMVHVAGVRAGVLDIAGERAPLVGASEIHW